MSSRLVIISANWPEFDATAAGLRMHQLIDLLIDQAIEIHYATTAAFHPKHSALLEEKKVKVHSIALNSVSFDQWIKQLNCDLVLYDRYVVEEQFGWRVTQQLPNAITLLDTEDLHSLRVSRQLAHREQIDWSIAYWKAQDITKRELASIYRCDLSLIISKVEYELLIEEFHLSKDLLVELPFMPKRPAIQALSYEQRCDMVFIGNGMHAPNRDAITFLKTEVWPLIRSQLKEVKLHIYGAYLPQSILNYHQPKEGFIVHGKAQDALEVISASRVNLAPLRYGAGIKGKVVEAVLCQTPTVVSPIAGEGIDGIELTSCTAKDIAQQAIALYNNQQLWSDQQKSYMSIAKKLMETEKYSCTFITHLTKLKAALAEHRNKNFIGLVLKHQSLQSTKYLSKWIEEKNKK